MVLSLALALALVLANGFFVATEFAVARLRPTQIDDLIRDGKPGARSAQHAVAHIDAYLAACQLGITLASLGLGVVGKPVFEELLSGVLGENAALGGVALAAALAFTVITLLHVVVGELAPKSLAIANTAPVALVLAPPMRLFYFLTKPVVDLFNWMGNQLLKPFGVPPVREAGHAPHSEDELRELLRQASREGMIGADEGALSENVLVFGDRRVREAMTPRPQVDFLSTDDDLRRAVEVVMATGRTRLPLCEGSGGLDAAIGVINAKDLLGTAVRGEDVELRSVVRPLHAVADGERLDQVLRDMRRDRRHVAVVVDEHGTAVGLLSLEDILEEIVGEIEDEHDRAIDEGIREDGDGWRVTGTASLRAVATATGMEVDAPHEATIGGHVLEALGRVPEAGEVVELHGRAVEVIGSDDGQISDLRVGAPAQVRTTS
ncbi:MAG: hemolysin family protein [Actinomycetota bacterium]|nr:hemolysin family protein [Actinomycetota bacterium]